jgi:hypothetical protein
MNTRKFNENNINEFLKNHLVYLNIKNLFIFISICSILSWYLVRISYEPCLKVLLRIYMKMMMAENRKTSSNPEVCVPTRT